MTEPETVEKAPHETERQERVTAARAEDVAYERRSAIWLEVSEVRYGSDEEHACSIQLKGDKEQPKPAWWPVTDEALGKNAFETYKAILEQIDKKRLVLARLSYTKSRLYLHCSAFRFQAPDLGIR